MSWSHVAAGTAGNGSNAASLSPGMPAGVQVGDLLVLRVQTFGGTNGRVPQNPSGWTQIGQWANGTSQHLVSVKRYESGDAAPTVTMSGTGATNDTQVSGISAFRCTTTQWRINQTGATSTNASADNIGPITGITPREQDLIIISAGKANDFNGNGSLTNYTQSALVESTTGSDAGASLMYRLSAPSGATGDLTVNDDGGTASTGVGQGIMFSVSETLYATAVAVGGVLASAILTTKTALASVALAGGLLVGNISEAGSQVVLTTPGAQAHGYAAPALLTQRTALTGSGVRSSGVVLTAPIRLLYNSASARAIAVVTGSLETRMPLVGVSLDSPVLASADLGTGGAAPTALEGVVRSAGVVAPAALVSDLPLAGVASNIGVVASATFASDLQLAGILVAAGRVENATLTSRLSLAGTLHASARATAELRSIVAIAGMSRAGARTFADLTFVSPTALRGISTVSSRLSGATLTSGLQITGLLRTNGIVLPAVVTSDLALVGIVRSQAILSSAVLGTVDAPLALSGVIRSSSIVLPAALQSKVNLSGTARVSSRVYGNARSSVSLFSVSRASSVVHATPLTAKLSLQGISRNPSRVFGSSLDSRLALPSAICVSHVVVRNSILSSQLFIAGSSVRSIGVLYGIPFSDVTGVATYGLLPLDAFFDTLETLVEFDDDESELVFDDNTTADWE